MGIGIVIISSNIEIHFQAQTKNFPSSTRAEIMAILITLTILPTAATATIYTDSQNAIHSINTLKNIKQIWKSSANPLITQLCIETINKYKLKITTTKIKAHTGILGNEKADQLAKISYPQNPPFKRIILPNNSHRTQRQAILTWKNNILDIPINKFLKTYTNSKWLSIWRTQNYNIQWLNQINPTTIDWINTWKNIHPSKITNNITNYSDHNTRIFNHKLINDELPTLTNLHKRKPNIYKQNTCPQCTQEENTIHIFQAHGNDQKIYNRYIQQLAAQTSCRSKKKQTKNLIEHFKKNFPINNTNITHIIKGTIPHKITQSITEITENKNTTNIILKITLNNTRKTMKEIWKLRCEQTLKWEKENKITRKDKHNKHKTKNLKHQTNTFQNTNNMDIAYNLSQIWLQNYINNGHNIHTLLNYKINTNGVLTR